MQLMDSFYADKIGKSYWVTVRNFRRDKERLVFQFDTGASYTVVGLNSICDDEKKHQMLLKGIIEKNIKDNDISIYGTQMKTATGYPITAYPCRISGVSIMNTVPRDMYFHISTGDINTPLLGFDFLDCCTYHHDMNGDISVLSVAADAGKRFYPDNVINFDLVLDEYYEAIKEENV